ncbi:MAG TPA: oligopeptide/dipeptide ABC transporter ATP-binding protein [Gammaproteobacteria bacterium]|nr:oligopeptide/dipeptide ABC transporter ATP-binding protein [Gammaproteobacteria bacterium]
MKTMLLHVSVGMNSMTIDHVLLKLSEIKKHYPVRRGVLLRQVAVVHAVDDVSLSVNVGETLGIVGESGCGKSTLARCIMRLEELTSGSIEFEGADIGSLRNRELKPLRRKMQMIFQDPSDSLNPRHPVGNTLEEPFLIHAIGSESERKAQVAMLLKRVGLNEDVAHRFPHEFSGGQRQRIGIARAIALQPKLLVCDEAVSALDVSIQSQILNLLMSLQREMGLTLIFIAHDLSVVKHISDRIAVMYLGKIVETADAETLYRRPLHPYTQSLIAAIPVPDPVSRKPLHAFAGDVPSPINPPAACRFHTRCPFVQEICRREEPLLQARAGGSAEHKIACHFAGEVFVEELAAGSATKKSVSG